MTSHNSLQLTPRATAAHDTIYCNLNILSASECGCVLIIVNGYLQLRSLSAILYLSKRLCVYTLYLPSSLTPASSLSLLSLSYTSIHLCVLKGYTHISLSLSLTLSFYLAYWNHILSTCLSASISLSLPLSIFDKHPASRLAECSPGVSIFNLRLQCNS